MFCVKNLSFLWNYCLSCELFVVIQDSEDGERTVCKKCARKIVNCYRMFAELREALASGRTLDKGEKLIASSCFKIKRSRPQIPSTACPSSSIPVRG